MLKLSSFRGALRVLLVLALPMGTALPVFAQATGSIAGRVVSQDGAPAPDIQVFAAELRQRVTTGADGAFRFDAVPPGDYLLEASSERLGSAVERVAVPAGGTAEVTLTLDLSATRTRSSSPPARTPAAATRSRSRPACSARRSCSASARRPSARP